MGLLDISIEKREGIKTLQLFNLTIIEMSNTLDTLYYQSINF